MKREKLFSVKNGEFTVISLSALIRYSNLFNLPIYRNVSGKNSFLHNLRYHFELAFYSITVLQDIRLGTSIYCSILDQLNYREKRQYTYGVSEEIFFREVLSALHSINVELANMVLRKSKKNG